MPDIPEFIVADIPGTLYIVATPIGNLEDLSPRALRILKEVSLVAAEDTRHSKKLFVHFGIATPLLSFHDYNEDERGKKLLIQLQAGADVALISDAGTPLISDPGYNLVKSALENHIPVVPVPGPSAITTALSAGGLPAGKFIFEGFPPDRHTARISYFNGLKSERRSLVFFEAPHRINGFLDDLLEAFGPDRVVVIARELTKKFESIRSGRLEDICTWVKADTDRQRGEFVILVQGAMERMTNSDVDIEQLMSLLLEELPLKKAANMLAKSTGMSRNELYQLGLRLQGRI